MAEDEWEEYAEQSDLIVVVDDLLGAEFSFLITELYDPHYFPPKPDEKFLTTSYFVLKVLVSRYLKAPDSLGGYLDGEARQIPFIAKAGWQWTEKVSAPLGDDLFRFDKLPEKGDVLIVQFQHLRGEFYSVSPLVLHVVSKEDQPNVVEGIQSMERKNAEWSQMQREPRIRSNPLETTPEGASQF